MFPDVHSTVLSASILPPYQILIGVSTKMTVLWNVTPWRLVDGTKVSDNVLQYGVLVCSLTTPSIAEIV
jgi:hypothetical protein